MANVIWTPNPGPQVDYLASDAFEVLFGGRRGGGKSETSLADATRYVHHPRFAGIAFRQTYPELEQLIERSHKFYGGIGGSWNGTARTWRFPSGATIKFRHLKDANAYRQYLGHEYQWMLFEELTSFEQHVYSQLKGSCRSTVPGLTPTVRATTNPGGPGHNWVKAYFVDVIEAGKVYTDPVTGLSRQYIPCPMAPQILEHDPDYVRRLKALPDADRKAWLEGDWDAYTGSVFKLERGVHTWTWEQFEDRTGSETIPKDWTRFRLMDWGYAHPFAILWFAVDPDGVAYLYREWYGVEVDDRGQVRADVGISMAPTVVAKRIKSVEDDAKERMAQAWTGPDMNSAGTGDTSAGIKRIEYFNDEGVFFDYWTAGDGSRKAKKAALHERLHYSLGPDGEMLERPGLVILTPTETHSAKGCGELSNGGKHTIRTVPALEYDPRKGGEDINSDHEDHCYDAASALALMRPWKPTRKKTDIEQLFERRKAAPKAAGWMAQ